MEHSAKRPLNFHAELSGLIPKIHALICVTKIARCLCKSAILDKDPKTEFGDEIFRLQSFDYF